MATVHVREVPEETLVVLKIRAARAGQSLQAYVLQLLEDEATMLTAEEAAARARSIAARGEVDAGDVLAAICGPTTPRTSRSRRLSGRRS